MLITATGEMLIPKKDSKLLDILDKKLDEHNVVIIPDIDSDYYRVTIIDKPTIVVGIVKSGDEPEEKTSKKPEILIDNIKVNNENQSKTESAKTETPSEEVGRGIY